MPEVDNLAIRISAETSSATKSLDALIGRLDRISVQVGKVGGNGLKNLASGVSQLSKAVEDVSAIDSRHFSTLSKNINKIGGVNSANLFNTANSLQQVANALSTVGASTQSAEQITNLAGSISKLGRKSVTTAITNIPLLAKSLKGLMTTLSTAPQVSSNLVNMTNALANLASQGSKIGTVSKSMTSGLNRYSKSASKASKSTLSLSSAIGKFWASYYLIIRGASKLKDAVESSMDYMETLNYFDAAFGQVAENADLSQYEELGYESAEAYYNSFSSRAKELTSKMSGFNIGENGQLISNGGVSLGINPEQVMNYQAMFGQMASSMGVASETSLKLSQALTEIGADLASVKNMDFEDVWENLASGLGGASRALDKFGVNIRNVNLQQKLTELGIDANITALNQNDKALLRTIILLESTEYAWGDLADTIEMPANQMRLLESNLENLSRSIGNIFLPIVAKALPYINGFVIALQRMADWLVNLLGFEGFEWGGGFGEDNDFLGDILDEAEDTADAFDDASGSVKKLKQQLQGFDELNNLSSSTSSGSTVGISLGDTGLLDEAFNEAFEKYQKAWDEALSEVESRAQEFADKFEEIFINPIKSIIEDFAIGDFFKVGEDTGSLVIGIFDYFSDAIDDVDWDKIGENIGKFLRGVDWLGVIKSGLRLGFNIAKAIAELWFGSFETAPIETSIITALATMKFTGLGSKIIPNLTKALSGTKLFTGISGAWKSLGGLGGILTTDLSTIMGAGTLTEIGMTIGTGIIGAVVAAIFGFNIGKEIGEWINPEAAEFYQNFTWFGDGGFFPEITEDASASFDALLDMVSDFKNNPVIATLANIFLPFMSSIAAIRNGVENSKVFSKEYWTELGNNIKTGIETKWDELVTWWQGTALYEIIDYVKENFTFENIKEWFSNIPKALEDVWNAAVDVVKGIWNGFATWINEALNFDFKGFEKSFELFGEKVEIGIPAFNINLGKLPTFEFGGYPEVGDLFVANEAGPELVGTINGRNAVASGGEITGIRDAVYSTAQEEIALMRQQNELLRAILQKEFGISSDALYKSVRNSDKEFAGRTGRSAFSY